jgi:transposase
VFSIPVIWHRLGVGLDDRRSGAPARIAAYAKSRLVRTKTDKSDAALIAHFCAREQPLIWTLPEAEVQELQALVRRTEMLD